MAGQSKSKIVAVLASAGAVALAALGARAAMGTFDPAQWGRQMEGRLRESGAALHARVATLAELPILAAAVSTDPQTVRDLTQDELAFRPRPGETVAIGQLSRVGTPLILLALPKGAEAPPIAGAQGPTIGIAGDGLVISEAVRVTPRERADELQGVVAASQRVDLDELSRKLAAEGVSAAVTAGGQTLSLGPPRLAGAEARRFDVPVDSPARGDVRLILFPPPEPTGMPYWLGATGLVAIAFIFGRRGQSAAHPSLVPDDLPAVWRPAPIPAVASPPAEGPAAPSVLIGATGTKVGRYQIIQHIGTGGMADVYLAQTAGEGGVIKRVAFKVLERSFARQPEAVEHFLDEARVATMLDHPNIVQIIDVGRGGEDYYIAMEFVDGADLARLIEISSARKKLIPVSIVLAILRKVCDALYAAHTARAADGSPLGVVHRDMKCGNVLVARNGVVKITDFGIAMTNHASRMTRTQIGLVKGTPGYMAPEHRLGQRIDGRADLYGVGAIAYEMLTGTVVNLELSVLAQRGRDGWPHLAPLSKFRDDVPEDLDALVFRALSYEAADRFADCAVMELALEAIARRYPPAANDRTIASWIETLLPVPARMLAPEALSHPRRLDR